MNNEIVKLLGERFLGKIDVADWAIKCLEKGFDSKSLRILASMNNFDSPFELDDYFKRTLEELGWNKISRTDCLLRYSKIIAQEIVEDKRNAFTGSRDIYKILVDLDYPPELYAWFEIDEMLWDYEHFIKTGEKYYYFHPKDKLVSEIKRLSQELIESKKSA